MQELLILGLVPGTNIQITFAVWLAFIAGCAVALTLAVIKRRHVIRNFLIAALITIQTRRLQA